MLSEILRRLPFAVTVWRLQTLDDASSFRLVRANPAASEVARVPLDQYVGKTLPEVFPYLPSSGIPDQMLRAMQEGRTRLLDEYVLENPMVPRGIFATYAFPLPENCVGLAIENLGARQRGKETLERVSTLLELSWDSVIGTDMADQITYWNEGAEKVYGWTRSEAVGQCCQELLKTESDMPYEEIRDATVREAYWDGEFRHTRKDGGKIVVYSQRAVQHDAVGKPFGQLQVDRDITRRRQVELALTREREFSSRLIESSLDSIFAIDRGYRCTVWNRAMEKLTAVTRKDALGRNLFEVLPFLREIGEERYFQAALKGESVASNDRPYCIPAAQKRGFFEARYSPIRADVGNAEGNGEVIGALIIMRDVSERRRSEESLRLLSARLLQVRDEERRRIARNLHDGTTQTLMGIKLGLAALRRKGLYSGSGGVFDEIIAMADRAIQEVRTTSYLLHPPELDLIGLAGAVRSYARGFAERTGIKTEVEIAPDLGRFPQDIETALFRIVQESLANVHRHSHSPTAKIRLRRNSDQVIEEIQDFGQGMPSTYAAANPDASIGVGIAGMGTRVRQLGGEMRIDSGPEGTLVGVTIPIAQRSGHAQPGQSAL